LNNDLRLEDKGEEAKRIGGEEDKRK